MRQKKKRKKKERRKKLTVAQLLLVTHPPLLLQRAGASWLGSGLGKHWAGPNHLAQGGFGLAWFGSKRAWLGLAFWLEPGHAQL